MEKMSRMKANIDNHIPSSASLSHLRVNRKREQILEANYTQIDRENHVLLQRMSDIIKKPSVTMASITQKKELRSLNRDSRRKELKRITDENHAILKRIQSSQPSYDHVKWEQEFKRSRDYLKNTCELPIVLGQPESPGLGSSRSSSSPSVRSHQDHPESVIDVAETGGDVVPTNPDFKYLAKEGKRIGDTFYLIEVSSDGKGLLVTAFSGQEEDGQSLELFLDAPAHKSLFDEIGGDYSKVVERVRVRKGKIYLS
jgi:hypothetical protein